MTDPAPLQSGLLAAAPGVKHGFFTRRGGVSKGIYEGLNVGRGSGDDADDVLENRRRVAAWFGQSADALNTCYQIHSATAVTADAPWCGRLPEGDAVVTGQTSVICGVLTADCAPVLFVDPQTRIVAGAHAGWQGALNGVVEAAVEAMVRLGAGRSRILAAVGPCIAQASYEVGLEFLDRFEAARPGSSRFFAPGATPQKRQFDLPGFVLDRLAEAGVMQAEWVGRDTCAEAALFYSNRRAFQRGEPDYGRLMSAIMVV
ncbi:MAG TPA: peptidoglycan editing factor PgeF [Caulobacter sp.]|nr:peptidoglycan editing factor PgeF [Caulobacter sp.]